MPRLAIEENVASARGQLRLIRERVADFRSMHQSIGRTIAAWADRNFIEEGALLDEFPSGWPALSAASLARRRRRAGGRILYDTGRLARGIAAFADADEATIDNPVPYAVHHQFGQGVPRRPVLPGTAQARRMAVQAIADHVRSAVP